MLKYSVENSLYANDGTKFIISSIDLNNSFNGYLMLAKIELIGVKPITVFVNLKNKFDTVANGKHLAGYHFLKKRQLEQVKEGEIVIDFDFMEIVDMYKEASNID